MNRTDLQNLTKLRVREAKVLFDNRCYEGAYYLLGYAVECAFKACIAKGIKRYDFPDRKLVNEMYTHDLAKLMTVAELVGEYQNEIKINPQLELSWLTVREWSEQSRYTIGVSRSRALALRTAVVSRKYGVLSWLQKYW